MRGGLIVGPGLSMRPNNLQSLDQLAPTLKDFTALRTLIIRGGRCLSIMPSRVVSSFASLSQLTSLEMGLANFPLKPYMTHHLCESINQLIPSLKSLRCKLLESPPGELKELIISISVSKKPKFRLEHCSGHWFYYHQKSGTVWKRDYYTSRRPCAIRRSSDSFTRSALVTRPTPLTL